MNDVTPKPTFNRPTFFKQIWLVDRGIQLRLIGHSLFVAVVASIMTSLLQNYWRSVIDQGEDLSSGRLGIVMLGTGVTFFFIVILGLIVTNQVAGPLYRLRIQLKKAASGEAPDFIRVRKDDQLADLFNDYNTWVEGERAKKGPSALPPEDN
jgi:signal transduction histidine kinase